MSMPRSAAVVALLAVVVLFASARSAHAQWPGYSINQLAVPERGSEWFSTDSLDLRGQLRPAIGVVGEWAYRPLVAHDPAGNYLRSVVRNQFVLHPGASLVLWDRLRVAFDLPVQAYADGKSIVLDNITFASPAHKTSLGDLRLGATLRLFGKYGDAITGAFGVQVSLPTGNRASYAGDGDVRVTPQFSIAGDIACFVYAVQAGATIANQDKSFADSYSGTFASLSASAGLRLAKRRLVIGPEYFAHSELTHDLFFKKRATPMEGLIGLHYMLVDGWRVGAGIGAGITTAFGTPDRRGLLSVEWVPLVSAPPPPAAPSDRDQDDVYDQVDACPDLPGVISADPRANGCPLPPPDRDHDGVLDKDDACPDLAGDKTDDPKTNGCPPPPDRDHDNVLDLDDACPDQPGNPDPDPKKNGCPPPPDRDHDNVLDVEDACPDEPGNPDPDPKRNGCPKAFLQDNQIKILDQVKFKTGSAQILPGPESEEVLSAVLQVLSQHLEVNAIRIEGHTDNRGGKKLNTKLSKSRAQSVVDWLVRHGISASRLSSEGVGPERPIDTNETEEGRKNNRRVEFHVATSQVPDAPLSPQP
jgi:OOP family OmpA-OmpF porin